MHCQLKLITLNLPQAYIDGLEKLVGEELFPNRSEAIRIAVRDFCKKELTSQQMSKIFGIK
ncbi:MAG: ribbon-helix-helix protein, CopG family [Spirochaetes bacterium]|nr:ribbon-helix-helix protein, CopG family [Spirochaetota bacterium]